MFEWVLSLVARGGYAGVFLLMLAENVVPPIPSEVIMPLAGFKAAEGQFDFALLVLVGTAGSLLGTAFWYLLGRRLGRERVRRIAARHGRWLTLCPEDVDKAETWFARHGGKAVFLGRLLPTIRTLISVPAGIARMPLPRFLLWSGLGTGLWTALLAAAGYALQSQYQKVADIIDPLSLLVLAAVVLWYLYRVATFRPQAGGGCG